MLLVGCTVKSLFCAVKISWRNAVVRGVQNAILNVCQYASEERVGFFLKKDLV
jgi:hypothetical protein